MIINITEHQKALSKLFAKKLSETNSDYYLDSNQSNIREIYWQSYTGKAGEFAVHNLFKKLDKEISDVQGFVESYFLGWESDFTSGNKKISVKTKEKQKEGWIFQDISDGRRDVTIDDDDVIVILVSELNNNDYDIEEVLSMKEARSRFTKDGLLNRLKHSKWLLPIKKS